MITKISKIYAKYKEHWQGKQKCKTCIHYGSYDCELVEGKINPNGHCVLYK